MKEECIFIEGILYQYDRILRICDVDITSLSERKVFELIQIIGNNEVTLIAQSLLSKSDDGGRIDETFSPIPGSEVSATAKRRRDQVSCGSDSSNPVEAMKKVKDVMPRLMKSNSVDSDKKEPSENDALLNNDTGRIFETVDNSGMTGVGTAHGDFARATSLQECDTTPKIVEEEVYPSLPAPGCTECMNNNMCTGGTRHVNTLIPIKGMSQFAGSLEDLFKFPHRVVWDTTTKAVTLKTCSQGKFGFSYKVKKNVSFAKRWKRL